METMKLLTGSIKIIRIIALLLLISSLPRNAISLEIINLDDWKYCDKKVSIKTHYNNYKDSYIKINPENNSIFIDNSKDDRSKFFIKCHDDHKISIIYGFSQKNDAAGKVNEKEQKYLTALNKKLYLDLKKIDKKSKFAVYRGSSSSDSFAFKSHEYRFMVAKSSKIEVSKLRVGTWESFIIELDESEIRTKEANNIEGQVSP